MADTPRESWRRDFTEDEFIAWLTDEWGPFSAAIWKGGDFEAFRDLFTDDYQITSRRKLGSPDAAGDAAVELVLSYRHAFAEAASIEILRTAAPATVLERQTFLDEAGNTLVYLAIQHFRAGRNSLTVSYDEEDLAAALAEFDRLAEEY